jgi:hypothetical protein
MHWRCAPGAGTRFTITLPTRLSEPAAEKALLSA